MKIRVRCHSKALSAVFAAAFVLFLMGEGRASVTTEVVKNGKGDIISVRYGRPSDVRRNDSQRRYKEGELLVKFKPSVTEAAKLAKHRRLKSTVIRDHKRLGLHRIRVKQGMTVEEAIEQYRSDPEVAYAEPNYLVSTQNTPDDPKYGELWGLSRINAQSAWDLTTGSGDVVVAIIDSGIDYTHPDLIGNLWINQAESNGQAGIDDDGNGYIDDVYGYNAINNTGDPRDDNSHGTHVAGTIAAVGNNATGVTGVAWNAKVMACKFIDSNGSGAIDDAIECLEYIKTMKGRGVNIVATNNSWGDHDYSEALYDAIRDQKDILFVAAAGNDNSKAQVYPAGYDLPNIISVAASDENDSKASFSNYGKWGVDIAAPGANILSTVPGENYSIFSGTSMAAPHVTGLAALLKSQDGTRAAPTLKNLILTGGDQVGSFADLTVTERRINAYKSLSCTNSPIFAVLHLPVAPQPGVSQTLSAMSINCGTPVGPVSVMLSGGGSIALHDDGVAPDEVAGDGIFTAGWTPGSSPESLAFTSPLGTTTVSSPPVTIIEPTNTFTSSAVNKVFSLTFSTSGGFPPLTWSIAEGTLPSGLTLNTQTGEISGTPTVSGAFPIILEVRDSVGMKDRKKWTLLFNEGLRPGWPRELQQRVGTGFLYGSFAPAMADLDADGKEEIIVSDVNTLYVFYPDGSLKKTELSGRVTAPVVADLDGDGRKEIVVSAGGYYSSSASIFAFHDDLTPMAGFPAGAYSTVNGGPGSVSSPVVANFNGDGQMKIALVASPNNDNDPNFGKNAVIMVDSLGHMVSGWPQFFGDAIDADVPPAVGDLDKDGKKELVFATKDGNVRVFRGDGTLVTQWQIKMGPIYAFSPVLADMDGDGYLDIIVKYYSSSSPNVITAFDRNGTLLPGWPKLLPGGLVSIGPITADIDRDGLPEIVAVAGDYWQELHLLRADGTSVTGWPVLIQPPLARPGPDCHPVVADIDGDGKPEVLITGYGQFDDNHGQLLAYRADGSMLSGFPKYASPESEIRSSAAIGDIDGNGKLDLVVKSENGFLYAWEMPQNGGGLRGQWPMFRNDAQHTGTWTPPPQAFAISGVPAIPTNSQSATLTVGGAGVVAYRYKLGAGAYSTERSVDTPIILNSLGEGSQVISVVGKNAAGVWQLTPTIATWTVDLTPATTTAAPGAGMYNAPQTVSLVCSDGTSSGCASTYYCLGAGCRPTAPYSGPVAIASSTDLRFYSTDLAGNKEEIKTISYSFVKVLNLTVAGTGSGAVVSTPNGISASVSSSAHFNIGATVSLHATPSAYSIFSGWSGACTGTADCVLTMTAERSATATFTKDIQHSTYLPSRGGIYNPTVQDAYNAAADHEVIRLWGTSFTENIVCAMQKRVTVSGGYDEGYTAHNGKTMINGRLTISSGTLVIENLILR